jgi:hypothetical protein
LDRYFQEGSIHIEPIIYFFMKKFQVVFIILLLTISFSSYGQFAVGYGTDGNTLSFSTNPSKKLWGELRVNTKPYDQADWSYNDRGITQAYLLANIFTSEKVSLYVGGGLGMSLLSEQKDKWTSVNIPIGLKLNPLTSLPNLFLFGEYNPMIITSQGAPIIHSMSVGFRYILSKKE